MKKNHKLLMAILTVGIVTLVACGNASNEPNATLSNQSQNNNLSQNTNDESNLADPTENASNSNSNDTGSIGTENNNNENNETNDTVSLKEEYLNKLNEVKNNMEEMRKNPIDNTTFAMKKVEGDIFNVVDGLLNEIYGVLKEQLPSEEMEQLREKQREWINYRDNAAKEASLEYEGGTMEQLEYTTVLNNLTEERCFELVENYMK